MLLVGEEAYAFWFGVILMSIVVPCFDNLLNRHSLHMVNQAISSAAILFGGFSLRYVLLTAGLHVVALPPPVLFS
jgi:formate-dependent nitrite reductase membrane component NrfD